MGKRVLLITGLFSILSPFLATPGAVSAGFFDFIFGNQSDNVVAERSLNSQNIALLQAAVNPNPDPAQGGGDITIVGGTALLPESGPTGTLVEADNGYKSNQISIYIVRSGDTLSGIAKMFGVSVNTILWSNDISGVLKVGQKLVILPISGISHTVAAGETISSIVAKYKGDLQEVLQYNNLSANAKLAVGDEIIIPDAELEVPKSTQTVTSKLRGAGGPNYAGYYIKPVASAIKTQGLHGYNAVDLGAPIGTPVVASASGDVIVSRSSGWNGGYGQYIVIQHSNGTQTLYGHLSQNIVGEGFHVVQGQVIGLVGSTGKSTGPHLHFEVRGAKNPF